MLENKELEKMLESGESLLWSARPDAWLYARPTFMIYIIAVPWTVFTFFWLNAVTDGFQWPQATVAPIPWWMPWVAIWVGLFLLVTGLWMLSAPFWIWRRGRRTIQALTTRRALIVDTCHAKKSQSLTLEGKVDFRITYPDERTSDMDVVIPSGKGVLFRAVREPQKVIQQVSANIWS